MTINSRKNLSLSVKTYSSKKKQMGGQVPGQSHSDTVFRSRNLLSTTAAELAAQAGQGTHAASKMAIEGIVPMLNDPLSGGIVNDYTKHMASQQDIRNKYINKITTGHLYDINIEHIGSQIRTKKTTFAALSQKPSNPTKTKTYSIEVTTAVHNLRLKLLRLFNEILQEEINEIRELQSSTA